MSKPVTMWAVVRTNGNIDKYTLSIRRKDIVHHYGKRYWEILKGQGYRAVKVRVEVVE